MAGEKMPFQEGNIYSHIYSYVIIIGVCESPGRERTCNYINFSARGRGKGQGTMLCSVFEAEREEGGGRGFWWWW